MIEIEKANTIAETVDSACEAIGAPHLYPFQRLVIHNILEVHWMRHATERDYRTNQVVLLPTGSGKSLCFQLPAVLLDGITLVVYPLLGLINDQLRRLNQLGIPCAQLIGGQTAAERADIAQQAQQGALRILLTNPETAVTQSVLTMLHSIECAHLVIDEAHCIAAWGTTFRPTYLDMKKLVDTRLFKNVTAFTATASPQTLQTIRRELFMEQEIHVIAGSPDRSNLIYGVRRCLSTSLLLLALLGDEHDELIYSLRALCGQSVLEKPAIVFCNTRGTAENYARLLRTVLPADSVRFYHAGLNATERADTEKWFFNHRDAVLCATCAYGMGMDKSNIRSVAHTAVPTGIENYLQEAGRGGRDGKVAQACLLVSIASLCATPSSAEQASLSYATTHSDCRRRQLLAVLGSNQHECSGCDVCNNDIRYISRHEQWIWRWLLVNQRSRPIRKICESISFRKQIGYASRETAQRIIHLLKEEGVISTYSRGPWRGMYYIPTTHRRTKKELFT